ncbi:unnamed protein product, partial [Mycena citricolor]
GNTPRGVVFLNAGPRGLLALGLFCVCFLVFVACGDQLYWVVFYALGVKASMNGAFYLINTCETIPRSANEDDFLEAEV